MPNNFNDNRQEARNGLENIYENKICAYRIKISKSNIKAAFNPHVLAEPRETF
jgi:hypothetical protein